MTSFIIYSIINIEKKRKMKKINLQFLSKNIFKKNIDKLIYICYNKNTKGKVITKRGT